MCPSARFTSKKEPYSQAVKFKTETVPIAVTSNKYYNALHVRHGEPYMLPLLPFRVFNALFYFKMTTLASNTCILNVLLRLFNDD
jgi:hypothetical protein